MSPCVSRRQETPFDSIESAQEYLRLLAEEVAVVLNDVEADAISAARPRSTRRIDALRLVLYKLQKLQQHVHASRRILNDLRTLRRLLAGERSAVAVSTSPVEVFSDEEPEPPGV